MIGGPIEQVNWHFCLDTGGGTPERILRLVMDGGYVADILTRVPDFTTFTSWTLKHSPFFGLYFIWMIYCLYYMNVFTTHLARPCSGFIF